jgi:hypothetical protein
MTRKPTLLLRQSMAEVVFLITETYPRPAMALPAYRYERACAPVWRPPPRMKIMEPMRIVHFRPRRSPTGPARKAPMAAPPVKTETTAPLEFLSEPMLEHPVQEYSRFVGSRCEFTEKGLRTNRTSNDTKIVSIENRSQTGKDRDEELHQGSMLARVVDRVGGSYHALT